MSHIRETFAIRLGQRLQHQRQARSWALSELADRSGVSTAMISKIERGEANATAIVLGKLSAAFGQTLSTLLAGVDKKADRHSKRAEQSVWKDSQTGYVRRALSPPNDGPLQLTEILLPAGARVNYPAAAYSFIHQQVWLIKGKLVVEMGEEQYRLQAGDCLEFGPPADTSFANESDENCRYLVAILVR